MLRRLLLALALTVSVHAALPEGEFRVTRSTPGLAPNFRERIDVVSNGRNYLATWMDERAGWEADRLVAARVDRQGAPLDPLGIGVSEISDVFSHAAASDGEDYLVAWQSISDSQLRLARIDGETGLLTQFPATGLIASEVSLVWIGDAYALLYEIYTDVPGLYLAVIDRDGNILTRDVELLRPAAGMERATVVATGGDLLVVWNAGKKLYATRINGASMRGGAFAPVTAGELFAEEAMNPKVVTDGTRFFALYRRAVDPSDAAPLRARILDAGGKPVGNELDAGTSLAYDSSTEPVWTSPHFIVFAVAADAQSLTAIRFSADGTRVDAESETLASGNVFEVAAAAAGGDTLFIRDIRSDIYTMPQWLARPLGDLQEGSILSFSEPDTGMPTVLWRGDHYLSIWLDASGGKSEARFGRYAPDGTLLGSPTLFGETIGEEDRLSAATDGQDALVVWSERNGIEPDRLRGTFIRHDGADVTIDLGRSHLQSNLAVSWNGSEYLVAWSAQEPRAVVALRVSRGGEVLDTEPAVIAPGLAGSRPAMAWDGTHWVVAYLAFVPIDPDASYLQYESSIHAVRLTRSLVPTGPPMRLSVAEPTPPRIAVSANEVLVTWASTTDAYDVYATRIADGVVLDGPAGLLLGEGIPTSVHADPRGGYVLLEQGGHGRILRNGISGTRQKILPFVPELAWGEIVHGGPRPLVVFRRQPAAGEQMLQIRAQYLPEAGTRRRSVRD